MSNKTISPISLFSIRLEMIRGGEDIGVGTGFIYFDIESDSHYLITNYHVLTARSPSRPSFLLPGYPDSPDEIRWNVLNKNMDSVISGSINLLESSGIEWLEHSKRKEGVDIVAIKIHFPSDVTIVSQDKLGLIDDIELEVGSDLFIVGYPHGIAVEDIFPLWKKGTIASEPLIRPKGLSRFYIDATTTPGMSGSPVFAVENRQLVDLQGQETNAFKGFQQGKVSALDAINNIDISKLQPTNKKHFQLVGIYSGRLVDGKKDPSIGIVWTKQLIEELFSNQIPTMHPYPPHKLGD
ncbi:S1 family peptidase [Shewanella sp. YLB-07]|uniref:S1 family peptidase n=1 Tax=Shewanella sp. YLB-07 TaxID=2601268 RepID=UPI00128E6C98|nr:serine protease [Shewanella sp. YLB-07]MPY25191.1 trypsin-like peptidase domain-containing protein [Shewanella sp. YLB-07]